MTSKLLETELKRWRCERLQGPVRVMAIALDHAV